MLSALLSAIVPTFGIIAVGWFCRWRGIFSKEAVRSLNAYAYVIALPALIFQSVFAEAVRARFAAADLRFLVAIVAGHLLAFAAGAAALRWSGRDVRSIGPVLLAFGSTAYLGIPFATFAFGPEGTAYAAMGSVALVVTILFASIIRLNRAGHQAAQRTSWHQLFELPFLWVVLAGILLPLIGIRALPNFLNETIAVLAGSAGPTALLAIGAFDFDLNIRRVAWRWAIPFGIGKVVLPTLASVAIALLLGLSGLHLAVAATLSATSIAITAFVLADEYHVGRELADGAIAVSSLASFLALSVIAWLWVGTGVFS